MGYFIILLASGELSGMIITPVLNNYKNKQSSDYENANGFGFGKNYCFSSMCGLIGVLIISIGFVLLIKAQIEDKIYYIMPLLYLYFTFTQLVFLNFTKLKNEFIKNESSFETLRDLFSIVLLLACVVGTFVATYLLEYFSFEMLNRLTIASYGVSLVLLWFVERNFQRFKVFKTRQVHFVSESLNL